eukprot:TRINITY_DN10290_c0_g1_i2.p2 TRINITY_DN10290_c0_g1~~TRINITY_DN10290_c0_g1_i2.p2  ORF type:complete len:110 (-),score=9.85 TRINITY_DN10290_c0_g1_i2:265-594(-)
MTSNKDFDDPMFGQSQNVNIQATSEELGFGRTLDVPTSQVKKTIQTCRQICEEVSKRSDLPSNYKFTNRLNYVKEMSSTKEEWWLETFLLLLFFFIVFISFFWAAMIWF